MSTDVRPTRATDAEPWYRRPLVGGAGLLILTLAAYLPVILTGGFIWDDPDYVIDNTTLRSLDGLRRMWLEPLSLPQYYPVVHATFWVEYHLWKLWPAGYHVDNVLLHAAGAALLWGLLKRLGVPGAWLAAAVFAVHPVHVESVAWVTERKNVLSLVFYLAAMRVYLFDVANLDGDREGAPFPLKAYFVSLLLFVLALLSKSVTCSLPAAILLVIYWKRGRVRLNDLLPLIPFFVVGLSVAGVTAHLEKTQVGAVGREWAFTPIDRCLIAGNAVWFYAIKLLWPHPLSFIYPRWHIDARRPELYVAPVAAVIVVLLLFALRRRTGRGPLVAVLFFVGTLTPALGFFNVYPMRYSFVADHFQYHASIGLIVLFSAGAAVAWRRRMRWDARGGAAAGAAVVVALAAVAAARQSVYRNPVALWRDTREKNPYSFMVYTNLGNTFYEEAKRPDLPEARRQALAAEARGYHHRALELAPDLPDTHWNEGIALEQTGRDEAAMAEFRKALEIDPDFAIAYNSMGLLRLNQGRVDEAIGYFDQAVTRQPGYAEAQFNLGVALDKQGRMDEAVRHYFAAVTTHPELPRAHYNLGVDLAKVGRVYEAIPQFEQAIDEKPDYLEARCVFAAILGRQGRTDEARGQVEAALKVDPNYGPALQVKSQLR